MNDDDDNHVMMDDDQSVTAEEEEGGGDKGEPRDELMSRVDDLLNAMNEPAGHSLSHTLSLTQIHADTPTNSLKYARSNSLSYTQICTR